MTNHESERRRLRDSALVKVLVMGGLVLMLLIPLGMVSSLVAERQSRQRAVEMEVASTWGGSQTVGGPLLIVPFRRHATDAKGKVTTWTELAYFLPEALAVSGKLSPERRRRGIFEAVVYRADLDVRGSFRRPSFAAWRIADEDVQWEDAVLSVGVPDLRGVRRAVPLAWGGRTLQFSPGAGEQKLWGSGLHAPAPLGGPGTGASREAARAAAEARYPFSFHLGISGSREFRVLPSGRETNVALASSWPSPSFAGAFLPVASTVRESGFAARWSVSYFGRGYPQQWLATEENVVEPAVVAASAFGVDLFLPADAYQKTERSVKYGVLFLLLTFLTFFLYELFQPVAVHPLQYLLVGSALCLFYLLLLSISEQVPFGASYAIAAAATVALIGGYSAAILRGRGRALLLAGVLGLLYGYLYVLLQAEDYALLLGSIGLFLILALVMWITRRIDWYAPRPARAAEGGTS